MKCQSCGDNEATVHWTEVDGSQKTEKHLCEECARKQSIPVQKSISLGGMLQQLLQQKVAQEFGQCGKATCPTCGMSFLEFRSSGRLGCPNDYEVFREGLGPMLERLQDGGRHCGKAPRAAGQALQAQNTLIRLRRDLERAIQREDYEGAVEIRDRIHTMEREAPNAN